MKRKIALEKEESSTVVKEEGKSSQKPVKRLRRSKNIDNSAPRNVAKKSGNTEPRNAKDEAKPTSGTGEKFLEWFFQKSTNAINPNDLFRPTNEELLKSLKNVEIIAKRVTIEGKIEYLMKRNWGWPPNEGFGESFGGHGNIK